MSSPAGHPRSSAAWPGLAACVLVGASGCSGDGLGAAGLAPDMAGDFSMPLMFYQPDLAGDLAEQPPPPPDACGDVVLDPSCIDQPFGPQDTPFPLKGTDPRERDQGLRRDGSGYIILDGGLSGRYSYLLRGCTDAGGLPADTPWWQLAWDAEVPAGTTLIAHAKSGAALDRNDQSWTANHFTPDALASPVDLQRSLMPNVTTYNSGSVANDPYLIVEFLFTAKTPRTTPRLKFFDVGFRCPSGGG